MTLLEEYKNQSIWRDWERYLMKLPLNQNQTVYDLGCSIGIVSELFSTKVKKVVGFDNDKYLLEEANKQKQNNCQFFFENIFTLNPINLEKCDGIWSSFTLAYMKDPSLFISNWIKCLNHGGWFAVIDIDGLFSRHLPRDSKYFDEVQTFENESKQSGGYDFRIGSKIKSIMEENGLKIIIDENNFYDRELNFKGKATDDIVENWAARLKRMSNLKFYFGTEYSEFCSDFLDAISNTNHMADGCVRFYVGIKT